MVMTQTICQGRLTLNQNFPVSVADIIGATHIYFVQYKGNKISLYNGSTWDDFTFNVITFNLSGLTSGLPYDLFIYNNMGVPTLESKAWFNNNARLVNLKYQDGILVDGNDETRRFVGTFYTTSSSTTEDSKAKRFLWNYYNQVPYEDFRNDPSDLWQCSGNGVWSAVNDGNPTWKHEFVTGWAVISGVEYPIKAEAYIACTAGYVFAIALDGTSPSRANGAWACPQTGINPNVSNYVGMPSMGYHFLQVCQSSYGSAVMTAWGDNTGVFGNGITAINSGFKTSGVR